MNADHEREYSPVERAEAAGSWQCKLRSAVAGLVLVASLLALPALANTRDDLALGNTDDGDPTRVATWQGAQRRLPSFALDDEVNLSPGSKVDFDHGPRAGVTVLAENRGGAIGGRDIGAIDGGGRGYDRAAASKSHDRARAEQSQRAERERHDRARAEQSQRAERARESYDRARAEQSPRAEREQERHDHARAGSQRLERQRYDYRRHPQSEYRERVDPDRRTERERYGPKHKDDPRRKHKRDPGESEPPTDIQLSEDMFDENADFSATLTATDEDSDPDDLTFSLLNDPTGGFFAVDGNQLALTEPLDFDNLPMGFEQTDGTATVGLTFQAADEDGNLSAPETIAVTVNEVPEPEPEPELEPQDETAEEPLFDLASALENAYALNNLPQCSQWIRALVSDHSVIRCYAALALASLAADVANNALANMDRWLIEASDPREIRQNLEALAGVSAFLSEALPVLVDARADWDPPVKDAARGALQVIDTYADHTVELLDELDLARHPDPRIARSSIRVLSNLGMHVYRNEDAHGVLADALYLPDLGVRYYAARGVFQIDENVEAVAAAAERGDLDTDDEIRRITEVSSAFQKSAVAAFASLGPEADAKREELVRKLRTGDPGAKAEAVEELGDVGLFVTSPLPVLVRSSEIQQQVAAGEAPSDLYAMLTVPDLVQALDDRDTRLVSAGFLGEVGAAAAAASADLERLKGGATGREAGVVADDVLTTISGYSDEAVVALLAAVKSPDQRTDEAAVRALGHLGSQAGSETSADAVFALIDVLKGGSLDAQAQAAAALADAKGDPNLTVPALTQALQAGDPAVQYEAARALRRLRAPAAIPELREALNADDLWLRYHAALALQEIDGAADAETDELQGVLVAVDDQSDRAVAELVEAVRIHDPGAVRKLQHIGPPATAAVPGLLEVLRKARPEDQDQIATLVRTVGASSLPEVRAAIHDLENAADPAARARAARTLGDIGARARTILPTLPRELGTAELPAHLDGVQALSEIGTTTAAAIDALVVAALADDAAEVREAARESLSRYALSAVASTDLLRGPDPSLPLNERRS